MKVRLFQSVEIECLERYAKLGVEEAIIVTARQRPVIDKGVLGLQLHVLVKEVVYTKFVLCLCRVPIA